MDGNLESYESVITDGLRLPVEPGLPFGIARNSPLVPEGDEWWAPMSDEEFDAWLNGK